MHNSNLIQLFHHLTLKDLRELRKVVNSPYFNQRRDVIQLFEYIVQVIHLPGQALQKEQVFRAIFPEQVYDDSKMRYVMSFLLKNIKQYLAHKTMKENARQEQIYTSQALRKLGATKLFEKEWKLIKKQQEKQHKKSGQYYYHNYLLYHEKYEHISQQIRSGKMYIHEMMQNLSIFFISDILRQGCLALAHKRLSPNTADVSLLENLTAWVKENLDILPSVVAIYYHSYQSLKSLDNEENFHQLKTLIAAKGDILSSEEQRDVYLSAINYSIIQINNGKRTYIREAFDLYQLGLSKGIFLDNGSLSHFLYKNILVIGLALGEKAWVKQFLEAYKDTLYPKNRENFYQYCLANFYFRTADYDKAMPILQQVDFRDPLNNLDARRMLLRIYFEAEEIDPLLSLLDSFSVFIRRRKKVLGYHTENYSNLIRFIRKMLKVNLQDKKVRAAIKAEVEATSKLAEKAWLLGQLNK